VSRPREPVIVGVYTTKQARRLEGRYSQDVVFEAVLGAIADAGLSPREVDGAAIDWPGPGGAPGDAASWAPFLHQPLSWIDIHHMDTAGVRGVLKAASAIESGLCEVAVVGSGSAGVYSAGGQAVGSDMGMEFGEPYGASTLSHFALVAQRHMHEFGTTQEQIAHISATIRNHGHVNPEASGYGAGPYDVERILASPLIATPLHRLDCCLINEGGAALVLTTAERARDLKARPVRILGGAMEFYDGNYANPALYRDQRDLGKAAAKKTFGRAGVSVADVDVFSVYDPCSFEVLRLFEMLGACKEGEGGAFCAGDRLTLAGTHPTNLDGGMLAYSWTGTAQLTMKAIEGVRQVRGTAGNHQVPDAELALVSNAGSGAMHIEMMLLGRA
jgi:acetyl-CoA acetyltransferase